MNRPGIALFALATTMAAPLAQGAEASLLNEEGAAQQVSLHAEIGALGVLAHRIQFGQAGSEIDYVDQGGQDNLFPVVRLSADLALSDQNSFVFLYQPLDLKTKSLIQEDLLIDGVLFPAGTPVDFRYGFSFWRASYLRDLRPEPDRELSIGASLQIRNAIIEFESESSGLLISNRDIGPVPIIKVRGRRDVEEGRWVGFEADGFYAPIKYVNGGNSDVVGAILDASVRGGVELGSGAEAFLNLRYLTGGAEGTSTNYTPPGDGYTSNWLHFLVLSLGFSLR